jgi:hypothetical protein
MRFTGTEAGRGLAQGPQRLLGFWRNVSAFQAVRRYPKLKREQAQLRGVYRF